jgi:hypothetical protein
LQIVSKQETIGVTNGTADNIKILHTKDPKMQPCRTPDFMEYEWEIKNSSKSNSALSSGKIASKPINMIKRAQNWKASEGAGDEEPCQRRLLNRNTESA